MSQEAASDRGGKRMIDTSKFKPSTVYVTYIASTAEKV